MIMQGLKPLICNISVVPNKLYYANGELYNMPIQHAGVVKFSTFQLCVGPNVMKTIPGKIANKFVES